MNKSDDNGSGNETVEQRLPRVFISYAHEDGEIAEMVGRVLKNNCGVEPIWDVGFAPGCSFHDQIRFSIAHAHVFLPIITLESSKHGWVHQEIGFAMALNVPVLPIAIGTKPGQMLAHLKALSLKLEEGEELGSPEVLARFEALINRELTRCSIRKLIDTNSSPSLARFEVAPFAEDRARMLAEYANEVALFGRLVTVRQKGALSTFHMPTSVINATEWDQREGSSLRKSDFHRDRQRQERLAFEEHASASRDCRLIVDPAIPFKKNGRAARIARLTKLREFLEKHDYAKVAIASPESSSGKERSARTGHSVTIVGDWFYAESVSAGPRSGYLQTIFTRHAPSMQSRIDAFDAEFFQRLADRDWNWQNCNKECRAYLTNLIEKLPQSPSQ